MANIKSGIRLEESQEAEILRGSGQPAIERQRTAVRFARAEIGRRFGLQPR